MPPNPLPYRGRIAPTPTGFLHLGHAKTFWTGYERCRKAQGTLILRNEDLDPQRCKPEYADALVEDLQWLGIRWEEGPDRGGPYAPYTQSERFNHYWKAWKMLKAWGHIYPCNKSRKDVQNAVAAPHGEGETLFPKAWRPPDGTGQDATSPEGSNWRFRVPDGEKIAFYDLNYGKKIYQAGRDFGDFLIWRKDNLPAYELAVVVDDRAMGITEVVRGADLLVSTARQILLYRALGASTVPAFYHCPLICDDAGNRLAKRNHALSLRTLRKQGADPRKLLLTWKSAVEHRP